MEKEKQIREIKTILNNNNLYIDDWDLTSDSSIYCEIISGISLDSLNKIQSELSHFEIKFISGSCNSGIILTFELK